MSRKLVGGRFFDMFPLKDKILTSGYKTFWRPLHNGADYRAFYADGFAPFNGEIVRQGIEPNKAGHYMVFVPDFDKNIEIKFFHLSKRLADNTKVKEGDKICVTGQSGNTRGAHLHLEVWADNKSIDPEKFDWQTREYFKLAILNLDVAGIQQLPRLVTNEIAKLSQNQFKISVDLINYPRTDALRHIANYGDTKGLDFNYIQQQVDSAGLAGHHTAMVVYHFPRSKERLKSFYNLRPHAFGAVYRGMFLAESWFWEWGDIAEDPSPGWLWAVIHELLHTLFFRLSANGVYLPDTTHNNPPWEFGDEFKTLIPFYDILYRDMNIRIIQQKGRPEVWVVTSQNKRMWVEDVITRDTLLGAFGLDIEEDDPAKYQYAGSLDLSKPDDPLKNG